MTSDYDPRRLAREALARARVNGTPYIPPDRFPQHQLGDAYEGPLPGSNGTSKPRLIVPGQEADPEPAPLPIMSAGELMSKYPDRRPAVIDGLLRVGETMNVIAPSKTGKSWLTLSLAFAVHTGRPWLSSFQTRQGMVLVIDNELHRETITHRLRTLAGALNWPTEDVARIDIMALRGRLENLYRLGDDLRKIERGRYALVIIDAWYRTLPQGTDENDNASMAALYNQLDCIADKVGASFALVHHASKGDQSAKSITDVGSGAGAQARATDTHLILRPHEEDHVVVLDAAVRSWPPVAPCCLRWGFPQWTPAPELDPSALRKPNRRQTKPEREDPAQKPLPWTAKRFADTFGKPEPRARGAILEDARLAGLSDRSAKDLLAGAVDCDYLFSWKEAGAASKTLISTVKPADQAPQRPRGGPKKK